MKTVIIKTQKQFDALPASYKELTKIEIRGNLDRITKTPQNAYIAVYDSATIESVSDSATIEYVYDSATIESVSDSATIEYVYDSATIKYVSGSATICLITGMAIICFLKGAKKIVAKGYATLRQIGTATIDITKDKTVTFIQIKGQSLQESPTFSTFQTFYPVDVTGKTVLLYKAVHKREDRYFSDYDKSFEYPIGETITHPANPSTNASCSTGLHVSHYIWAKQFGRSWSDLAILECEVPINKIIVAKDCDGKVRTSELKVIREMTNYPA